MPSAVLYRMAGKDHLCPFGLRSLDLLKRKGFTVEDRRLQTRDETDALKKELGVKTTPQIFIEGERIGGYDKLREYLGIEPLQRDGTTYLPVAVVFAVSACMALMLQWRMAGFGFGSLLMDFVAFSMTLLALLKLRDLHAFANQFITYDLLGMRQVRYAYIYPFAEAWVGLMMLAASPAWSYAPIALLIGAVGASSVVKAVYIDRRELKCACVGGNSNVPLGPVSLLENLVMVAAGTVMLLV